MIKKRFTCLLFGEGRNDKDFIYALSELEKFKYHTKNWHFTYGNGHGCSAADVIKCCIIDKTGEEDLAVCFIDLDDLKSDYLGTWEKEKDRLEAESINEHIKIVWFLDKSEDEYRKVLGAGFSKRQINREAKKNIEKFINSDLWKRILQSIKEREDELQES